MSEWKFGDWCEGLKDGKRYRFLVQCAYNRDDGRFLDGEGVFSAIAYADLKPIPDCTGWDWQPPKLQLREGAWYERVDGKIVGPCSRYEGNRPWVVSGWMYDDDGTNSIKSIQLVREVDPPKPKYRPFKNADEFKPHRERWLVCKAFGTMKRVCGFDDKGIWFPPASYQEAFEQYTFDDGTPVGVEE